MLRELFECLVLMPLLIPAVGLIVVGLGGIVYELIAQAQDHYGKDR